ncbi:MAG: TIR domain-containing protein [Burkholderiales bacterium]|nr:TIR domain-containing protein [Burkholderiales bacterium]
MTNNTTNKKYHAFISYRHADNVKQGRQWATWLHNAIETYDIPEEMVGKKNGRGEIIPQRIYPVFRDEEELPADANLGKSIIKALDDTRILIVLCSPSAVASTYVADEIDYFKRKGNSDRIIAAIIDGEPNASWDYSKQNNGFSIQDECFPAPLQFEYDQEGNPTEKRAEPVAADFRINNEGKLEQGWTNIGAYRQYLLENKTQEGKEVKQRVDDFQKQQHLMLLKIIAGILGIPLSDLAQRDKEYQLEKEREKAKTLRKWLSAVAALAIIAISGGVIAWFQAEKATEQLQQARIARASLLAGTSEQHRISHNPSKSLAYAEAALSLSKDVVLPKETQSEIEKVAFRAFLEHYFNNMRLTTSYHSHVGKVTDVSISNDRKYLASAGEDGIVNIFDYATGDRISTVSFDNAVQKILFSNDRSTIFSATRAGELSFVPIGGGQPALHWNLDSGLVDATLFDDGSVMAWGISGQLVRWRQTETEPQIIDLESNNKPLASKNPILSVNVYEKNPNIALIKRNSGGFVYQMNTPNEIKKIDGKIWGFESENGIYWVGEKDQEGKGVLVLRNIEDDQPGCRMDVLVIEAAELSTRTDRALIWNIGNNSMELWSLSECKKIEDYSFPNRLSGIRHVSENNRALGWNNKRTIGVINTEDGSKVAQLEPKFDIFGIDTSQSANRVLAWNETGGVTVWSLDDGTELFSSDFREAVRDVSFNGPGNSIRVNFGSGILRYIPLSEDGLEAWLFHDDTIIGYKIESETGDLITWSLDGLVKRWVYDYSPENIAVDFSWIQSERILVESKNNHVVVAFESTSYVWDMTSGELLGQYKHESEIEKLLPGSEKGQIRFLSGNNICAWDYLSQNASCTLNESMESSDNGEKKVTQDSIKQTKNIKVEFGELKTTVLCKTNGDIEFVSNTGSKFKSNFSYSSDLIACFGEKGYPYLVSVFQNGKFSIIDIDTKNMKIRDVWTPELQLNKSDLSRFSSFKVGKYIVFNSNTKRFLWLDPERRKVISDINVDGKVGTTRISEQLRAVSIQGEGRTYLDTGQQVVELESFGGDIGHQFLERSPILLTWSTDHRLRAWDVSTGKNIFSLPQLALISGVAESQNGELLAVWTDIGSFSIVSMRNGQNLVEKIEKYSIRNAEFLENPYRLKLDLSGVGPKLYPMSEYSELLEMVRKLTKKMRPLRTVEKCNLDSSLIECDELNLRVNKNLVLRSRLSSDNNFLANFDGAIELGILRDGGITLVADEPFPDIVSLVEFDEEEQIMILHALDGSNSALSMAIPANMIAALGRKNTIIIFTLFGDNEPLGYSVPLISR